VTRFHSNKGKKYVDRDFNLYLQEHASNMNILLPMPMNKMVSSNMNIIVMDATHNILHARNFLKFLWAETINTMVHLLNRTTTRTLGKSMPYIYWNGQQPNISNF